MKILSISILLLLNINICFGVKNDYETFNFANWLWENMEKNVQQLQIFMPADPCLQDLVKLYTALYNKELWAFKMIDSASKIQSGILEGNVFDFGNFDECLAVRNGDETIKGKYCLSALTIEEKFNKMVNYGSLKQTLITKKAMDENTPKLIRSICFPHRCSAQNITGLVNLMENQTGQNFDFAVMDYTCQTDDGDHYRVGDCFVLALFGILIVWVAFCTVIEVVKRDQCIVTIRCFSLYYNGQRLFDTTLNGNMIGCLNGIRALSILWIVVGHRFFMNYYVPFAINNVDNVNFLKSFGATFITGGTVAVDTFLVLSGFLLSMSFLKKIETTNWLKFPWVGFYVHRYIRLTTALLVVLIFTLTILKFSGKAPIWDLMISTFFVKSCQDYWWSALLYVQNYVNPTEVCLDVSWYLSVDMQLYILSPLLLLLLGRSKKIGYVVISILIVIVHITVFLIVYKKEISIRATAPTLVSEEQLREWNANYYQQTHTRAGPWLIGICFGYFMLRRDRPKLNKISALIIWITCFVIFICVVIGIYPFLQDDYVYNKVWDSLFLTFHRTFWSIAICLMIYNCYSGYGGPINWFLSLKFWLPICRISYSLYLVHLIEQAISVANTHTTYHFSVKDTISQNIADIVTSGFISTMIFLIFESPVFNLEGLLLGTKSTRSTNELSRAVQESPSQQEDLNNI